QLEGPWGNNGRNYMMGPFNVGESPATRADIFIQGLRSLNRISNSEHDQNFSDLEEEQVISLLEQCEADELDMGGMSSAQFFQLLRTATIEGVYSDPVYGGNRNKEGWRMKEYP